MSTPIVSELGSLHSMLAIPRRVFLIEAACLPNRGSGSSIVSFLNSMGITPVAVHRDNDAPPVPGVENVYLSREAMPTLGTVIELAQNRGVRVEGIAGGFRGDEDIAEAAAKARAFIVATGSIGSWCFKNEGKKVAGNGYVYVGNIADAMHPLQQRLCGGD